MRKTKGIAVVLAVIMSLMLMPVAVGANDVENITVGIQPFWSNVDNFNLDLERSGNMALCGVEIRGVSGVTSISADITLYRVNPGGGLQVVHIWSRQGSRNLTFSGSASITGGSTYRLSVSARVVRGGVTEHVSRWIERQL